MGIEYLQWKYNRTHNGNRIFTMGRLYNPRWEYISVIKVPKMKGIDKHTMEMYTFPIMEIVSRSHQWVLRLGIDGISHSFSHQWVSDIFSCDMVGVNSHSVLTIIIATYIDLITGCGTLLYHL